LRRLATLLYQGGYEVCSLLDGAHGHDQKNYAGADAVDGFKVWESASEFFMLLQLWALMLGFAFEMGKDYGIVG